MPLGVGSGIQCFSSPHPTGTVFVRRLIPLTSLYPRGEKNMLVPTGGRNIMQYAIHAERHRLFPGKGFQVVIDSGKEL